MTKSEAKHYRQYQRIMKSKPHRQFSVVDLKQSEGRPVATLVSGALPALRTSSCLYFVDLGQFLSGRQMMRCQGFPIFPSDSEQLHLSHCELPRFPKTALGNMAGNAMFGPCPALAVLAVLLYIQRV